MRPSDKEEQEMVALVRDRLASITANANERHAEYMQKRAKALDEIVRDVVKAYYGMVEGFNAIVRQIKAHFL